MNQTTAISVIIPAFNEERFLPRTLDHLNRARELLATRSLGDVEVIVADNLSTDCTAEVAAASGARVIPVPEHNVARVRNEGARAASGDLLIFLDADTLVPETLLVRIAGALQDPNCLGGAVDTDYRPARPSIRLYLRLWRLIGTLTGMAQGAAQFCRRDAFTALGGYDETIYMGEDVDFSWRLRRLARSRGGRVEFVKDLRVIPSCRRYDQWSIARTLVLTNPILITLFQRHRFPWVGWYDDAPR